LEKYGLPADLILLDMMAQLVQQVGDKALSLRGDLKLAGGRDSAMIGWLQMVRVPSYTGGTGKRQCHA
jgi:hypothetical protein